MTWILEIKFQISAIKKAQSTERLCLDISYDNCSAGLLLSGNRYHPVVDILTAPGQVCAQVSVAYQDSGLHGVFPVICVPIR